MIRAYVFDLDGTLYPRDSDLYRAMSASITRWFKHHLNVRDEDFADFYERMKQDYPSPLGAIHAFRLSVASYHQEVFESIPLEYYLLKDTDVAHALSSLPGKKFLVTLSSRGHSEKVLRALKVEQYFTGIYNPGDKWQTREKVDAYNAICCEYGLSHDEVCVIGDTYAVDLEAALNAGYHCVWVSNQEHQYVPTINSLMQLETFNPNQDKKKGR